MKTLFNTFFICFLILSSMTMLSAQIKMDFSAQFFPQQIDKIHLHTDAPVRYITTNSEIITLEISVTTNTRKHKIIDFLVEEGRYNVKAKPVGQVMNLSMPNLDKVVRINQKEFIETITYTIYIPRGTKVGQHKRRSQDWRASEILVAK